MHLLTARDAEPMIGAVAANLARAGVGFGERVALAARSTDDARIQALTVAFVLGALRSGVIPVMVNPALAPAERQYVLDNCDPALTVDTPASLARFTSGDGLERSPDLADVPLGRPMHYTSGTTGRSRGVWTGALSESDAGQWWGDEAQLWAHDRTDVSLVHGPVAHSGPLRFAMLALLARGSVIFPGRFDAASVAESLARDRPTVAFLVPSHLQRLLALPGGLPRSPYRLLVHAGAACPEPIKRATHAWAGVDHVWEFYGSTEGQFTACSAREWEQRPGTLGRARKRREIFTEAGVIWCSTPEYSRFEYFGDPEKTAAAWRGPAGEAAFTVGDLGRLDGDGYLWLDGRREDLVITGGVNVYPAHVESVLSEFPGVQQVAVFGVDDEQWGQRVCAAFVGSASGEALRAWARGALAAYEVPKQLIKADELPMTASGKIRRLAVAEAVGL